MSSFMHQAAGFAGAGGASRPAFSQRLPSALLQLEACAILLLFQFQMRIRVWALRLRVCEQHAGHERLYSWQCNCARAWQCQLCRSLCEHSPVHVGLHAAIVFHSLCRRAFHSDLHALSFVHEAACQNWTRMMYAGLVEAQANLVSACWPACRQRMCIRLLCWATYAHPNAL